MMAFGNGGHAVNGHAPNTLLRQALDYFIFPDVAVFPCLSFLGIGIGTQGFDIFLAPVIIVVERIDPHLPFTPFQTTFLQIAVTTGTEQT